jgi:ACS family tartrate transporter-like MFS transporter
MPQRGPMAGDANETAVGRSALAKASRRLLPLIGLGYGLAYIDRVNISFAALQMNRDLHFGAAVYGLGAGLFFLTYALFEVPSNLLLVRFGARRWIARIMLTWGVLAAAMLFVRTPMQFYLMRLLLGAAEAGFFPGVIYYLSQWFPAAQRGRAISRFYVAAPLSTVVMGVAAGALLNLQGKLGLAGWQWLFLAEGLPAVLLSVVVLFLLPDKPQDARWLTAQEQGWIVGGLAEEWARPGVERGHGVLRALLDPVVLRFAAVNFLFLGPLYAFNLSAPTLLDGVTHLGATKVGYLTAVAGLLGAAAMLLNGWASDRRGERYVHLVAPLVTLGLAYGVMSLTASPAVVVGAYFVAVMSNMAISPVIWLAPGEAIQPSTSAASIAAINSVGQLGSFVFPSLWGLAKDQTGSFHLGLSLLPIPFLVAAVIVLSVRRRARLIGEAVPALVT